jgi:peptide/nickel transport system substrate-binding protein
MVSPKAAKALGDKLGTQPVCAGPYKLVQRVAQGKIVMEKVADYWDKGAFSIDRIEFVPITDSTSRLASLRSGDLQMIERASPTDLAEIRGDSKLKVTGVPELGYQMIPLNVANGPKSKVFADVRVRQALDLAIDRETLVKTVFNGEYIAGNQFISPANPTTTTRCRSPSATSRRRSSSSRTRASRASPSRWWCRPSAIDRRRR